MMLFISNCNVKSLKHEAEFYGITPLGEYMCILYHVCMYVMCVCVLCACVHMYMCVICNMCVYVWKVFLCTCVHTRV